MARIEALRIVSNGSRSKGDTMKTQRFCRTAVMTLNLALFLPAVFSPVLGFPADAQQSRGPVQRTLIGKVTDKSGAAIKGAVVYLQDGRTSAVRSEISTADGSYRFVQLSQGTDYSVWAQIDGKKSKTKQISSFDSKKDFDFDLTID